MAAISRVTLDRIQAQLTALQNLIDPRPEEVSIVADEGLVQLLGWPDCVQPLVDAHMDAHSEDRAAKKVLVIATGVERAQADGKHDDASIELVRQLRKPLQIEHKPQEPTLEPPQ